MKNLQVPVVANMPHKDLETRRAYHRAYTNDWMKADRKKNPEKYKQLYKQNMEKNPAKRLINSTKQSAKLKNLEHNIQEEDLVLPAHCPYLQFEIDYSAGTGKTMLKPSVDRIDPTKGYIKGNVEVISSMANTMKSNATPAQLILFAKELLKRYDNPSN